jgi:hypothetical protein
VCVLMLTDAHFSRLSDTPECLNGESIVACGCAISRCGQRGRDSKAGRHRRPPPTYSYNTPHTLAGRRSPTNAPRGISYAQPVSPTRQAHRYPQRTVAEHAEALASLARFIWPCRRLVTVPPLPPARGPLYPGTSGAAHDDTGCWLGRCGSGLWEWSGRLVAWEGQAVAPDLWRPLSAAATLSRRCRAGLSASILVFVVCGRDMRQCCTPRRQAAGSERSGEHITHTRCAAMAGLRLCRS